jgi:ABC-type branched-subunit amino acid transport system substrate-binding protein
MVVIDSGGTAEAALAGLERAALQDGAIAVVGPLLSDETPGIAAAADALRIPLFSLSQSLEDASAHPWVVQAMPTRGGQAEALAAHVVGTKGWRRFATFAPDNAYGRSAAEAFAVAVTAAGGSIAATQWFQPDANDLIPDATKLRKVVDEHDFDALFVPQNARDLPFATAALAVVEFPMGEYLPEKGKSPYRALLGLATWNNPSLLTNGGPYVRTGLFVDVFSASAPGDQAAFVERYRTAYARTPSSLEASAWDAGRLLGTAARSDAATRDAFLAALRDARVEGSVTGADHVDAETHEVGAAMRVYTITRNGFEIVE